MCIDATIKQMENVLLYFEKYQDKGFTKSMDLAKTVALEMNIELIFSTKCRVITKKNGENNEDHEHLSPEESFKVGYFLNVVDMTIISSKNRFKELKTFESNFGFLYDSQKLKSFDDNELKECCVKFHSTFLMTIHQMLM
ncbi:hypothetical protein QL285_066893 [Trifolium repens]|nr:hypothetical protein QL285_066893 [Trifolium repens]